MTFRPILCLDFDGVIHSYVSGWKGAHIIPDPPVEGATDFIMAALQRFDLAIYSSRSKSLRGRWAMKRWLRHHLFEWSWADKEYRWQEFIKVPPEWTPWTHGDRDDVCDALARGVIKRIQWPWFKPAAWMTIDDRAMQFTGRWPDLEEIAAFKPWNKRPRTNEEIEAKVGPPPFGYGL